MTSSSAAHRLGRYQLLGRIGAGGMGEVFLARQVGAGGFEKLVVIKRLLRHLEEEGASTTQFLNEARLAALLNHPNVAQVFELSEAASVPFMVMEHVHGRSLRAVIRALAARGDRLSVGLSTHIVRQVLRGLNYVHALTRDGQPLKLVHRDISPENILLSFEGAVKIIDFGIARSSISQSLTLPDTVKGKLAYLPPEILRGGKPDAGLDLFAAVVTLCECLLGANPFLGLNEAETVTRVIECAPVSLREARPDVPQEIEAGVALALRKRPENRCLAPLLAALEVCQSRAAETELRDLMHELFPEAARDPTAGLKMAAETPVAIDLMELPIDVSSEAVVARDARLPGGRRGVIGLALALVALGSGVGVYKIVSAPEPTVEPVVVPAQPVPPSPVVAEALDAGAVAATEHEDAGRRRPARPVQTGSLTLYVKPWAEVFWRGRRIGVTPFDRAVEFPAGKQVLVLKNSELNVERQVVVDIRAGEVVVRKINLE